MPPLNIGADKGTSYHRTRQFITAVTVIPDSVDVIDGVYIRQPVVKSHTGEGVVPSIKEGLDVFEITGEQLEGSSHDGQYFHLSVPDYLRNLYGMTEHFISTTDPLHLAGNTDTHIRKDASFDWMVKLFATCKELYNKFNWGKITSFSLKHAILLRRIWLNLLIFRIQGLRIAYDLLS